MRMLLKIRLSIRVRNFGAPTEPLHFFVKKFLFEPQSHPPVETLWCENENPSNRKSHTWAPLSLAADFPDDFIYGLSFKEIDDGFVKININLDCFIVISYTVCIFS